MVRSQWNKSSFLHFNPNNLKSGTPLKSLHWQNNNINIIIINIIPCYYNYSVSRPCYNFTPGNAHALIPTQGSAQASALAAIEGAAQPLI